MSTDDLDRVAAFVSPDYTEVYESARYPLAIEGAEQHILGDGARTPISRSK